MEEKIYGILNDLGVPFNVRGREYLVRAVKRVYKNGRAPMTKVIYPEIAKEFETTASRVERAIRHAVERAFSNGNTRAIVKYFGINVSYSTGKLTNSGFIYGIAEYLRLHR